MIRGSKSGSLQSRNWPDVKKRGPFGSTGRGLRPAWIWARLVWGLLDRKKTSLAIPLTIITPPPPPPAPSKLINCRKTSSDDCSVCQRVHDVFAVHRTGTVCVARTLPTVSSSRLTKTRQTLARGTAYTPAESSPVESNEPCRVESSCRWTPVIGRDDCCFALGKECRQVDSFGCWSSGNTRCL